MADSPFSTPKRKRSQLSDDDIPNLNTTTQFTFELHSPIDDGSASPRTRVAHRFRGLALDGGGGVGGTTSNSGDGRVPEPEPEPKTISNTFMTPRQELADGARKRIKLPENDSSDADSYFVLGRAVSPPRSSTCIVRQLPTTGQVANNDVAQIEHNKPQSPKGVKFALDAFSLEQSDTLPNIEADDDDSIRANPPTPSPPHSRGSLSPDTKSRKPKRAATPPLIFKAGSTPSSPDKKPAGENGPTITDPVRASLTWHDDEITIYDPDDSDDDGTGINGIGFKPTPAIAYARTIKRRQQLAEYRKREEREARAKRNQRRRGSPVSGLVELKGKVERRRVRFLESSSELIGV
ncbi:hypothetical protein B0H63DRAFT_181514 [Podospora didyma]|uniref:Uncharacterized protein n=1 Tax=Podospora didyma TaxID=330526 RepID=A0AAE0NPM6_9PEZI|nr:hypothetical protein B0H63DRAFT_181514 [Podospora didyma]